MHRGLPYIVLTLLTQAPVLADTPEELGRRLFFDMRLSGDGSRSCADCHDPSQGFSRQFDAEGSLQRLSEGYTGSRYFRNAPTLVNAYKKQEYEPVLWGWDGRMSGPLSRAIDFHLESPRIMNMDPLLLTERIKQDGRYVELCRNIFEDVCRYDYALQALSAFLTTLGTEDILFDEDTLSLSAINGKKLFEGKAGCAVCHSGPIFSDLKPHNTGLPQNPEVFTDPMRHLSYRSMLVVSGIADADNYDQDVGYYAVSGKAADIGKFITPTLRELRYTAPYMHNGMFDSLTEVVEFYNHGSDKLQPLGLSPQEVDDIVAFLESLSSDEPLSIQIEEVSPDYLAVDDWLNKPN